MATIQISSSVDMHNASTIVGTLVAHDSTHIQFVNNALVGGTTVGTYYGNFSYDTSGNVSGTLTGYTSTRAGILQWSVSGLNFPMSVAIPLIDNNELQQLYSDVLSGNDQFTLSTRNAGANVVIDGYGGYNTVAEPLAYSQYSISNTGTSLYVLSTTTDDTFYNIQGIYFQNGFYNAQSGQFTSNIGLVGSLNLNQQLELIYVAYFNRPADGSGSTFWGEQNAQAQAAGQSAAVALTNIANSFTPQAETIALYPFLGQSNLSLSSPAGQAGLTTFVNTLYGNLFGHQADAPGLNYWVGQLTTGAVGLGAAALAIANGATGSDATEVQNKIAVALDFTTRTSAAGLGQTGTLPAGFLIAARNVLSGVDSTSLNDASVTAGMTGTTSYIATATTSQTTELAATNPIVVAASNAVIDPGTGSHTIQFLSGVSGDTLVLRADAVDQVSGFDPGTDMLDVRSLLAGTHVDLTGGVAALANYLTIADQGTNTLVRFDPSGHGGGNTIVVLEGFGGSENSLGTLVAQGAVRIA